MFIRDNQFGSFMIIWYGGSSQYRKAYITTFSEAFPCQGKIDSQYAKIIVNIRCILVGKVFIQNINDITPQRKMYFCFATLHAKKGQK